MEVYQQVFFTTLALSFGLLHLILYYFNRRFKSNLFFSVFLFLYALNIFFDYQALLATSGESLFYLKLHRAVMPYSPLFGLLFLYYAFDISIPKYFWLLVAAFVVTGILAVIEPIDNFYYVQFPLIIVIAEAVRIFYSAVRHGKGDFWLLAGGFIILSLFSIYDMMMDLGLISGIAGVINGYPFGFVGLIICSSIYLARDIARANQTIIRKEREAREMELNQKILEAEDQRKARELKEARDVQLSLLPACITDLEDYEFCFEMRPATEVGGDYYDYIVTGPGKVSIVLGDATNHGMRAGMMVSIMKSLFLAHGNHPDISEFFNRCSRIIKQMKLKNLFMALMKVKIDGRELSISSAGIPSLLIYRKETGTIEEITVKGMPLGAVASFPYETVETGLNPGDTVLLMSDGILELFNEMNELFGSDKVKEVFLENVSRPVEKIVESLFFAADAWRGATMQNDDITLVAFRLKTGAVVN